MFLIHWGWCLPQALCGLAWYFFILLTGGVGDFIKFKKTNATAYKNRKDGVSLGHFIFYPSGKSQMLKHEYGHYRQSLMLGPMYLIVIGIPSFIWSIYYRITKPNCSYYSFYTERWADKLAGINRGGK